MTRYRSFTRWQATAVLTLLFVGLLGGLFLTWPESAGASATEGVNPNLSDLHLFHPVVERLQTGQGYYEAMHAEMKARAYPTGSLANWRLPLLFWLLGTLPSPAWGQTLFLLGGLTTLVLAYGLLARQGGKVMAGASVLLLFGAFLPGLSGNIFMPDTPPLFLYPEMWAGMLIALSVCAYGHELRALGVGAGVLALGFRELALPYCAVCVFLAWRQRGERLLWLGGLALFGLYFALHAWMVYQRMDDPEPMPLSSWFQFGGGHFVLATGRMHGYLLLLPWWATAIYLPLALLGLVGWPGPIGIRVALTAGTYVVAFAVVGKFFNPYWVWSTRRC